MISNEQPWSGTIQLACVAHRVPKRGAVWMLIILMDSQYSEDGGGNVGVFTCNLYSWFGSRASAQQRECKNTQYNKVTAISEV